MIPLFPEQVLDNSLHTAILVGLVVTWMLFETFGWVFAGFVVAGYLAALLVVAPANLAVVLVESILCFGLVWALGAGLADRGAWSRVFGRERFLLFVLVALPVRLLVTGLAMPRLEAHLLAAGWEADALGLGFFGVGVVLVPLTANTFWKVGLARGLTQLATTTGITWCVVGVLLPSFTNFGFSSFEQSFDALAVSAWSSSRVVLVLLATSFLAAAHNLRFGWDFGGILVPALLAMLVFTPTQFVTTLVEIVVLYGLYEGLTRLPVVRALDLEGPRRIVSIYAVSYAWKWALAAGAGAWGLEIAVSDLFGFGYLLTSLVVARIHKTGRLLRTLAPLVATSLSGVVVALPLALLLGRLPGFDAPHPADAPAAPVDPEVGVPHLAMLARGDVPRRAARPHAVSTLPPLPATPGPCRPHEGDPQAGAALHVLACGGPGPVLVVPRPRGDPDAAWLAGWLAGPAQVAGVAVAAVDPSLHPTRGARADGTAAEAVVSAQRWAGDRPVLVVLGDAAPSRVLLREPAGAPSLRAQLGRPDLVADTRAPPVGALGLWTLLRDQDGLLLLDPGGVPSAAAPIPLEEAHTASPVGPGRHDDLLPEVVLPALRRALHGPDGPWHGALTHLAGLVGGRWIPAVADDGTAAGVLVRQDAEGLVIDRFTGRAGGTPWVVMASGAWRRPALPTLVHHHQQALSAQLAWVVAEQPRGTPARRVGTATRRPLQDRITRALLRPLTLGTTSSLLLLDVAPGPADAVLISHGNEALDPQVLAGLADDIREAFAPWPGHRFVAPGTPEAAWQPSLAYAATYQQAVAPDRLLVAWYPPDVVDEARGAPDRADIDRFLAAAGVPVHAGPDAVATLAASLGQDAVPGGPPAEALAAFARTPSDATLAAVQAFEGWEVEVVHTGLRRIVVATDGEVRCTRVAAPAATYAVPWSGCWRVE